MEPATDIVLSAERVRLALAASSVWAPALNGSRARPPAAPVRALLRGLDSYFIVHISRGSDVTARFALDGEGMLLEAEGAREPGGRLALWWAPIIDDNSEPPPLVWKPCEQSMSRLRPFYQVSGQDARFVRTDGVVFHALTEPQGRG